MKYVLPDLPYPYDALEPYIDKRTMILHHTKHHQSYVDKLNSLLEGSPLLGKPIEELIATPQNIPADIRSEVEHNGGGHANHSFSWRSLSPASEKSPSSGALLNAIDAAFGSFTNLQEVFSTLSASHFASGWAWLCVDKSSKITVKATADHQSPLTEGLVPLLVLDLWEHAYYLKYQNRRAEYISAFWNVVDWAQVNKRWGKSQGTMLSAKNNRI